MASIGHATAHGRRLRGWALAGLCLALSLTAAQAQTTLRVAKAGAETFAFVPLDIGVEKGFFKKHGIDVEISTLVSSKIMQAMVAGSIDVGLSAGTDLAYATKAPLKGVAALAGPPTAFVLVVRPDESIRTVDDLKGRMIAVSANRSLTDWLATRLAMNQGWGARGVTTVGIGDTSSRFAAMKTKNVDAIVVDVASALQMEERGQGRILVSFGDLVPEFLTHAILASDQIIRDKPEAVRGFLAGWFDSVAYIRAHKAEAIALAAGITNVSAAVETQVYDKLVGKPFLSDDGRFDPKALAIIEASWLEMGVLTTAPQTTSLIDERFLPGR
jgi:NitT/TauT family transport system substrate-binding protein